MSGQSAVLDWTVISMIVLAVAASRLEAEVRARRTGAGFRAALLHPVLFACAVTLGPVRTPLPAVCAGICRVLAGPESRIPLHRFLYHLLSPVLSASACSLAFVLCGGSVMWPQSADSLPALACSGAVYALTSALIWAAHRASKHESDAPAPREAVAAGWYACLLSGYALAVFCASAPAYAVGAISVGAAITAWALVVTDRESSQAQSQADLLTAHANAPDAPSFIDGATGLANRRYLDLFLERELGRSQRLRKSLSVAVFNVDDFRRLDEDSARSAMFELGSRLAAGVREYDIAARHSDGRLVVVFPETPFETALEVVERLRRLVSAADVPISVGLATYPDHAADAQELINAAHYALNRGRGEGADRVHYPQNLAKAS